MYTMQNFRTKKQLREAVAAGQRVSIYQPGPFGGTEPRDGVVSVEGPHFPEPHRWYAEVTLRDGVVVSVK
jgi:hypothetical protein